MPCATVLCPEAEWRTCLAFGAVPVLLVMPDAMSAKDGSAFTKKRDSFGNAASLESELGNRICSGTYLWKLAGTGGSWFLYDIVSCKFPPFPRWAAGPLGQRKPRPKASCPFLHSPPESSLSIDVLPSNGIPLRSNRFLFGLNVLQLCACVIYVCVRAL